MKIDFSDRPYSGRNHRPKPEVVVDHALNSIIVAIPWGPRAAARKVIDRMLEYLTFAQQDLEATSPMQRLSCLSDAANNLRTATLLANDLLYRDDNRDEYRVGVELFAATLRQNEFSWVQVGGPHLLLSRAGQTVLPIGSQIDLAYDLSTDPLLPALPVQLLGLDSTTNLTINSFRARAGDKLLMVSHSRPPTELFALGSQQIDPDSIVRSLSTQQHDTAFWLGFLSIGGL